MWRYSFVDTDFYVDVTSKTFVTENSFLFPQNLDRYGFYVYLYIYSNMLDIVYEYYMNNL